MEWQSCFPFDQVRPAQADGLDFICRSLAEADDVFLEATTGVGKSGIAMALARMFAAQGRATYITTTKIALENQYLRDFARFGLRQLHSKKHYPCPDCWSCDVGARAQESRQGKKFSRCSLGADCTYRCAKAAFQAAPFGIANAAFIVASARFAPDWTPRHLAIFDEAHLLADTIAGGYSVEIRNTEVDYFPSEGDEPAWLRDHYTFKLNIRISELEEELDQTDASDPDIQRICQRLERAEAKRHNLAEILSGDPSRWVFDQQPDVLRIVPLWATDHASGILSRIGAKRVYLSATLAGFELQARQLGIDPQWARYLALPSPFPVENRLIHIWPVVRWDYRDPAPAIADTCRALEMILALHPTDRGLVHVSSYRQAREIIEQSQNPRLITHANACEKDFRLSQMYAKSGTVLVSPSSHEGLDLYDERSRFQVIAKLPFASLGDKRIKRRMETDQSWYSQHTAQKFVQACGRSIRSESDYAVTYVLDAAFPGFYRRAGQFLPSYIRDALRSPEAIPL